MFFFAQRHGFARKAKHRFGVLAFRGVVRRFVAVQNLTHPDRLTREREDLFFFFLASESEDESEFEEEARSSSSGSEDEETFTFAGHRLDVSGLRLDDSYRSSKMPTLQEGHGCGLPCRLYGAPARSLSSL